MTTLATDVMVRANALTWLSTTLLERVGVPGDDARFAAETLVEADLRGVTSHGTRALPRYLESVRSGATKARPAIRTIRQGPAFALLDGDGGLGQVVAGRAMRLAIELARRSGIAAISVENSNHYGAAAYYPMMAAAAGMIGMTTTNGGGKNMAAFGGAEPVVGNSPIAFAAPAGTEPPIVLDMATGVVAAGKIAVAAMRGEKIPVGWGLTAEGEQTDDPHRATIVLPLGAKGYGLAMMMDVLSGPLNGGIMSVNTTPGRTRASSEPTGIGHFFFALDVAAFTDLDAFRSEVDSATKAIRRSRRQRAVDRVYLPGEIEWNTRIERLARGIPLHPGHADALAAVARDLGAEVPWS